MKTDDIERFWSKVDKTDYCWIWKSGVFKTGYGEFSLNNKPFLAHRISYQILVGDIPKAKELHHICNNRLCVNINHLQVVTRQEHVSKTDHSNNGDNSRVKTHCPKGHPLSSDNLRKYALRIGKRSCKTCFNEQNRKYQESIRNKNR